MTASQKLLDSARERFEKWWTAEVNSPDCPGSTCEMECALSVFQAATTQAAEAMREVEGQLVAQTDRAMGLAAKCDELVAANEALRKDAERYRWLRDADLEHWEGFRNETLDRAIDSARKVTP